MAPRDVHMDITTAEYPGVIFTAVMNEDCSQCAILSLLFHYKPPNDTVSSDTPATPHYAVQLARGQLAIYVKTLWMAATELLAQLLTATARKFDADHAMVDHGSQ